MTENPLTHPIETMSGVPKTMDADKTTHKDADGEDHQHLDPATRSQSTLNKSAP